MKILKYGLSGDTTVIPMAESSKILCVQNQAGCVVMWAVVDETVKILGNRTFLIFCTGWEIKNMEKLNYIGTVQSHSFVWHVFEETK